MKPKLTMAFSFFFIHCCWKNKRGEEKKFKRKENSTQAHFPLTLWSIKDRLILHLIK